MLIDKLLAQIAPHECLGCATEGKLLCQSCVEQLTPAPSACYRCRKISESAKTCTTCRSRSNLFAVRAAVVYENLAKELLWQLKFQGAQAAADEIAEYLARYLPRQSNLVLVPIPTASSRVRQRGYDQAVLITHSLASKTSLQFAHVLRRSGQHHQVGSNREQRTHQLANAYRVVRQNDIVGKHVILVDDVLTTGATLEAAAKVMKAAGAQRVSGLVYARA